MTACYQLLLGLPNRRADIASLRRRLDETQWPDLPPAVDGEYGISASVAQRWIADWGRWLEQPRRQQVGDHQDVDIRRTGSVGSSMRIYTMDSGDFDPAAGRVPAGVSVFAARDVSARENNLVAWYEHDTGGHVASLDASHEFTADLTDFLNRLGVNT